MASPPSPAKKKRTVSAAKKAESKQKFLNYLFAKMDKREDDRAAKYPTLPKYFHNDRV